MARLRLEEAIQLGLVDPSALRGRGGAYGYSYRGLSPLRAAGGLQGQVPFWRLPPILQSSIYQPRFGLGGLRLGLPLSPAAPAIGAPGAVPVGRAAARRPLTPEEQAIVIEQMRAAGALPEPSLARPAAPARGQPPARRPVLVGRGQTPAAARAAPAPAPPSTDAGVAGDLADAFALRQALAQAGTVTRLGGEVARAVAGEPGFTEGVSPEALAALAEQRAGERGDLAPQAIPAAVQGGFQLPVDPETGLPGGGALIRDPATGLIRFLGEFPAPQAPEIPIDPATGLPGGANVIIDPVTGQPRLLLPFAPDIDRGRAVGAGPVAGPGAAQRALTAPAQPSGIRTLARGALPAIRVAVPTLGLAKAGTDIALGAETGNVPQIVGGTLGAAGSGANLAAQAGLIPARTAGLVSGLASAGGLGLGLATHDPASIASGVSGAIPFLVSPALAGAGTAGLAATGGVTAGLGAGATGIGASSVGIGGVGAGGGGSVAGLGAAPALGLGAALALVPAISMFIGARKKAQHQRELRKEAQEAAAAFRANPDVQQTGSNVARLRAGDSSVLPALSRSLVEITRTRGAGMLGADASLDRLNRDLWTAVAQGGGYERVLVDVARGIGIEADDPISAYDALNRAGRGTSFFGPPRGYPTAPPPAFIPPPNTPPGWFQPGTATPSTTPIPGPDWGNTLPPQWVQQAISEGQTPASIASRGWSPPSSNPRAFQGDPRAPQMSHGGLVPRTGSYSLEAGEAVLPAEVVRAIGTVLAQGPAVDDEPRRIHPSNRGRWPTPEEFAENKRRVLEQMRRMKKENPRLYKRLPLLRELEAVDNPGAIGPGMRAGGIVPRTGRVSLHAGEAVLPAEVAGALQRTLAQGGEQFEGEVGRLRALDRFRRGIPSQQEGDVGLPRFNPFDPGRGHFIRRVEPGLEPGGVVPPPKQGPLAGATAQLADPLLASDEQASRVWRILQGYPRPGDPDRPWFMDSYRGVPFQAKDNPDPDRVWRLVFSPAELAEAWPDRGKLGWPILLRPTDLELGAGALGVIEKARQEQYEHPGFRIDFLRERGYAPDEYRTVEEEFEALQAFGEARRGGLGKRGFIDVGDELEGLGEEELADNELRQRAIDEAANPRMPEVLESDEEEDEPESEEEEMAGATR